MRVALQRWFTANRTILVNASSLVSTTAIGSGLGFVFWWLAARQFSAEAVGLASAAISAMMLLGSVASLGMGTLLIGELPRQPDKRLSLLITAVAVVGAISSGVGVLFALAASSLSTDLQPLAASLAALTLFALGVSLNGATGIFDQAVIGLFRGDLQLWRNILFAVGKLIALWLAGVWMISNSGLTIYAAWVIGSLLSLLFLVFLALREEKQISTYRPDWKLLRRLGRAAFSHYVLNLVLQGPSLALPILTTILLSATTNAYFYAAWMTARLTFTGPISLTVVLYAVGAAQPEALARKMRHTLAMSAGMGLLAAAALLVGAEPGLRLFGQAYAEEAGWSLRILGLGIFPLAIRYHYIAVARIYGQTTHAALVMAMGGLLELALAAVGAHQGGLTGLSIGWVSAICVQAIFVAGGVYRAADFGGRSGQHRVEETLLHP